MKRADELRALLERIDHRGYPAYKDTKGEYGFPGYVLSIDHVQGSRERRRAFRRSFTGRNTDALCCRIIF